MSSFHNIKNENPTLRSKVMTSKSVMMRIIIFSGYLKRFNSDFDP